MSVEVEHPTEKEITLNPGLDVKGLPFGGLGLLGTILKAMGVNAKAWRGFTTE